MTYYATEQKYVALGKETTRGTLATPTLYLPVGKGTEFDYKLNLIADDLLRGIFERYPSYAGTKEGTGKITGVNVNSSNCGLLFLSLFGKVTSTQQGGTSAYQHIFEKDNSTITNPSLSFYFDRGLSKKSYNLCVVKSVSMKGTADNIVSLDADILFRTEADYTGSLTPTWAELNPFLFYQTTIKIAGTSNTTSVAEWNVMIDNGTITQRVLNLSQDVNEILTVGKFTATGSMNVYFENETERAKFLEGTSTTIQIIVEGATIESTYKHKLDISLKNVKYTAYPFGDLNGLLGATVNFDNFYSISDSKSVTLTLVNTTTAY